MLLMLLLLVLILMLLLVMMLMLMLLVMLMLIHPNVLSVRSSCPCTLLVSSSTRVFNWSIFYRLRRVISSALSRSSISRGAICERSIPLPFHSERRIRWR